MAVQTKKELLQCIKDNKPSKITFDQLDIIPKRSDFVDPFINKLIGSVLRHNANNPNNRKPIIFMPNTVHSIEQKYNNAYSYILRIFGVLPCGSKACVILRNFNIYFDIMVPTGINAEEFKGIIKNNFIENSARYNKIEDIKLFKFHGFQTNKRPYIRIYFNTTYDRKIALDLIKKLPEKYETTADDSGVHVSKNYYYLKLARENKFSTANWNIFYNYTQVNAVKNCKYCFEVDIKDYVKVDKEKRIAYSDPKHFLYDSYINDKVMYGMWDIETYKKSEGIPKPGDKDYNIFMISAAFSWQFTDKPMLKVLVVDKPTDTHENIDLIIECRNERELLKAHIEVLHRMAPDIIGGFYSSNFDWPIVHDKMQVHGLVKLFIDKISSLPTELIFRGGNYKYISSKPKIKIGADFNFPTAFVLNLPGILDTDIMPVFLQLYPNMEARRGASLNYFLEANSLGSKEDMPYKTLFKIYETACLDLDENSDEKKQNLKDMALASNYCMVDSIKLLQLVVKRAIVSEKRELANLSDVTLYDAFYTANSMKVINIIGAFCFKNDVAFSSSYINKSKSEKDHFPGGFVFPPVKGLNNKFPITGLDFSSLYPSLMMAYNLSPDKLVKTKKEADELIKKGYNVYRIKPFQVERGEKKGTTGNQKIMVDGWTVRHNGIITNEDKHIVIRYDKHVNIAFENQTKLFTYTVNVDDIDDKEEANFIKELNKKQIKFKRTVSYKEIRGREKLPGEKMGICPAILIKLNDKRKPFKKQKVDLEKQVEELKIRYNKNPIPHEEYEQILRQLEFDLNKTDSKQKAIKVLANTFYGAIAKYTTSIYSIVISGSITCAGQGEIKKINNYTKKYEFNTEYGDTDSLYMTCPPKVYALEINEYEEDMKKLALEYEGVNDLALPQTTKEIEYKDARIKLREKYWTKLVQTTMVVMSKLTEKVNDYLIKTTGARQLSMAYEEVGFPCVMCGKKKYFMTPHIDLVNFNASPMVKGIDIVKQGQAKIVKELGYKFINEVLSLKNEREIINIMDDYLDEFFTTKQDPMLFVKTSRYKQNKNVAVNTFVERMIKLANEHKNTMMGKLYAPPEVGDKFETIIVVKNEKYMLDGRKTTYKVGDRMEYVSVYNASQNTANPMAIDMQYYLTNVSGVFSRFICYHEDFQPDFNKDKIDEDEFTEIDQYTIKKAIDYIKKVCDKKSYGAVYDKNIGQHYKNIYKTINKKAENNFIDKYGKAATLIKLDVSVTNYIETEKIIEEMKNIIDIPEKNKDHVYRNEMINNIMANLLKKYSIFQIYNIYHSKKSNYLLNINNLIVNKEARYISKVKALLPEVIPIIDSYNTKFINLINDMRNKSRETEIDEDEIEDLNYLDDQDEDKLKTLYDLAIELISINDLKQIYSTLSEKIIIEKNLVINSAIKPKFNILNESKIEAKKAKVREEFQFP